MPVTGPRNFEEDTTDLERRDARAISPMSGGDGRAMALPAGWRRSERFPHLRGGGQAALSRLLAAGCVRPTRRQKAPSGALHRP